jgi:superfamily II DNA or RNA helicase
MSAEGLDIPELNTLLLLTPRKEVEQIVGRITRKKDHPVVPTVIDIVDQLPSFSRQFNSRKKFYESKDFIIKLYDVEGHKIIKEYDYEKVKKAKKVCSGAIKEEVDFID